MTAYQVAIIGHGSHGHDIEAIWNAKNPLWPMECFDDKLLPAPDLDDPTFHWYIGVNDSSERARIAECIKLHAMPLVHQAAVIDDRCDFGRGVVVGANTTITRDVRLGLHSHVNYNVGMTRTEAGDFVTISPGVTIAGDVTIGDRTMIGAGAVICDRVTIGSDVTIGAGTIILPETVITDGTTWVGNPARQLR